MSEVEQMTQPRIMIAAPRSGSGKTLITCALLQALKNRGLAVNSFKCGPDYIDPMFHQKVIGIPSRNLDLFFTNNAVTRQLYVQNNSGDVAVIEGVMGLYDGLGGVETTASSYALAKLLRAPIVLVVDTKGMGRSVIAEIKGFLAEDEAGLIRGVILNRMSSMLYPSLAPVIEEETGIEVLGFFSEQKKLTLESRHLGLKLPEEVDNLKRKVEQAADSLTSTVDIGKLMAIAHGAEAFPKMNRVIPKVADVNIAVARDEAFCFLYEDNLVMLEQMGAKLSFFSPLHDGGIPEDADGVIFCGGYPELYARELSENASMLHDVKTKLSAGLPSLAECGGFMYLHQSITTEDGTTYPMAGVINGSCSYTGHLVRFGYMTLESDDERNLLGYAGKVRGHGFHYFDSSAKGETARVTKPVTGKTWNCGYGDEKSFWSFAHLYYPSNPTFLEGFLIAAEKHDRV